MKPQTQYSHLSDEEFLKLLDTPVAQDLLREAWYRMTKLLDRVQELEGE